MTGYQAGSTFKLFTMLAALENGYSLDTGFDAPAKLKTQWADSGPTSCDGFYCPANDNPSWMDGYRTMWTGFGRSVNTYFVRLEEQVGAAKAVEMAQRLGIVFRAKSDADRAEERRRRLGLLHARRRRHHAAGPGQRVRHDRGRRHLLRAVARQGQSATPTARRSRRRIRPARRCSSPTSPGPRSDAARCPVGQSGAYGQCDGGTATQVSTMLDGRPVAGKTGSAEGNATESFVGFTPQVAAAGIAANPTHPSDGVGAAVQVDVIKAVASVLDKAVTGQPERGFAAPSESLAFENGSSPAVPWLHDGYGERSRRDP